MSEGDGQGYEVDEFGKFRAPGDPPQNEIGPDGQEIPGTAVCDPRPWPQLGGGDDDDDDDGGRSPLPVVDNRPFCERPIASWREGYDRQQAQQWDDMLSDEGDEGGGDSSGSQLGPEGPDWGSDEEDE
jgi:hypothetical protein